MTFDSKEKSSFWELKQNRINEYVELMLRPHFGDLMSFVNECEPLIEQGHKQLLIRYSGKISLQYSFAKLLYLIVSNVIFIELEVEENDFNT